MSRKNIHISQLDLKKVGGRIAYIRLKSGLTGADFAGKVGLTKGNISNLENHKYEPSFKVIVQICKQFEVAPEWLLTGEGSPYIKEGGIAGGVVAETGVQYNSSSPADNVVELEHADIIRRFRDKAYARDLNMALVELERIDPLAYREIGGIVKGVLMSKGVDSRPREGPGRDPQDDRRGDDRRHASGEK